MAAREELVVFVRDALLRGLSREQVAAALSAAGWSAEQVRSAVGAFADVECPVPVPRPRASVSASEAFTYLLLFTTLYVVSFNVGSLLFMFIDRALPDAVSAPGEQFVRGQMRFATSALIVAGPLFLFMSSLANRAVRADRTARLSPTRRWLTYLTLFVAACVLLGDVISLVYNLLGGETTLRFVLKSVVVGAIAGAVFWYYTSDLRADEREPA